jgi:hypothetical protein
MEVGPLIQEWSARVVIPAEGQGIPSVAPPAGEAVNREWRILWIDGYDAFLAEIAGARIQIALISERQSSLLATIGTECR